MNDFKANGLLKIRLTTTPPYWAEAALLKLRQQPDLEILAASTSAANGDTDIVLHFGCYSDAVLQQYGTGRLGFWFFRFGGQDIKITEAARRAADAGVALESSLWAKFADNSCLCLYQSFGQLKHFMVWHGARRALIKTASFPERVLSRYRKKGELVVCTAEKTPISNSHVISLLLAEVGAIFRKTYRELFYHEQWFIVAGEGRALIPESKQAKWLLNPPADSFWADPFIIEKDNRIWVLLEVLPFSTQRGYLAAIELFADGSHGELQTIMMTDYHLSYPFILEWQDELYLLPEAGASSEAALWKCEKFPTHWTKAAVLLKDICYSDASLIENEGLWWLFLTIGEKNTLNDELSLYYADSPLGPWSPHPENPVKSDARSARPAGNLFYQNGVLYRPSQDCSSVYGKATVLNRIDKLDKENFTETFVARIDADWQKESLRTHTLTRSENYWAIDSLRFLPRWAAWFKS